ncbi:MAG: acetamidase/formamidase family protein [Sphingomonas sp.]|uniref:acetamidase/formamidase family protein n=1 Tax=Sphingomonas sp. TaxID=28214 RepID=UPI003569AF41
MKTLLALAALSLAIPAHAGEANKGEHWLVVTDMWGTPAYSTMTLIREEGGLSGELDGDPVRGDAKGKSLRFVATDAKGTEYRYAGMRDGAAMSGEADFADSNTPGARARHRFTARRLPERPEGLPRTYDFTPTDYSNLFSADRAPVLTIWPGDTVRTSTVDSGGVDAAGVTRALFGNPQTGPFYVDGAVAGDTLAIHIKRLTPNRDYADSLDSIVGRALGTSLVAKAGDLGKPVRWKLDRATGRATPEGTGALKDLSVPMRPMLGGLAVAPGFGSAPMSTGDTGRTGGNMDFNEVVAGNTVFLPVQQPGALLYLGDAHALQGDGETSQYALETSMDVEFGVELIKGRSIGSPRVESPTQIMVLGQAGSLDEATKAASTGLIQWLQQDYGLTLSESAQLMGSAVRLTIANLAGRSVGVSARIDKALLPAKRVL